MAKNVIEVVIEVDGKQVKVGLDNTQKGLDKFGKSATTAGKQTKGFGQNMLSLQSAIAAVGLAGLAQQTISFAKEAYAAAAASERLGRATENLAQGIGSSGDAMVSSIQAASMETISKTAAMEAANKAMLFGLVENSGQMEEMTQIAITLGAAMGQDATKSLDDLTTALGRQSPMILDNLGITLKVEEAQRIYAASLGKTVEALTEEEKKQAFVNAALIKGREMVDELGGVTLDSAGKTEQLSAAWADFTVAFGGLLTKMSGGAGALTSFVGELEKGASAWGWIFEMAAANQAAADKLILAEQAAAGNTDAIAKLATMAEAEAAAQIKATVERTRGISAMNMAETATAKQMDTLRKLEGVVVDQTQQNVELMRVQNFARTGLAGYGEDTRTAAEQHAYYTEQLEKSIEVEKQKVAMAMELMGAQANLYIGLAEGETTRLEQAASFGAKMADISQSSEEKIAEATKSNSEKLVEIETERAEKIAWVMTGAHNRTAEENAAALGHWNAHYDELSATATAKTKEKTDAVLAEQQRAEAAANAARAKEKADLQAHLEELKIQTVLSMLETTGQLEQLTGLVGIGAGEAADLITAGLLPVTQELALAMQGQATGLEDGMAKAGETATANQEVIAAAMAGSLTGTQEYAAGTTEALLPVNTMFGETLPATLETTGAATGLFFENATLATNTMIETALTPFQMLLNDIALVTLPELQAVYESSINTMIGSTNTFIGVIGMAQSAINALAASAVAAMARTAKSIAKAANSIREELIPAMKAATSVAESLAAALERVAAASTSAGSTTAAATGLGFAAGTGPLGFEVPPGFPNDSFPINVQSGERVLVAPRGQSIESLVGGRGGNTVNNYFNQTVNTNARASSVIGDFKTMQLMMGA